MFVMKTKTTEAQIVQKLKNEARPKFTGSYKKEACNWNFKLIIEKTA